MVASSQQLLNSQPPSKTTATTQAPGTGQRPGSGGRNGSSGMVADTQQRGRHMGIAVRDSVESERCIDAEKLNVAVNDGNIVPLVSASA